MNRGAIVVMAKAPREGSVKTRLIGAYAPRDVVALSECLLLDTLALVRTLPRVHVAVVCPAEDVAEIARRADIDVVAQRGEGLAAALVSAFEQFVPRFGRVVAVDSDSPHLPLAILESAFELLETNDVVVGPTEDGGYYLVGASHMYPHLFDAGPLGTRDAREALLSNARGLSVALTPPWYDVDVPADLRRLAADLRVDPSRAPRTAALLASWDARDEELTG